MALFVVLALGTSAPDVQKGIEEHFPDNFYLIEAGKWLVATSLVTAKQVSDRIGITNDENIGQLTGLVIRMAGYFGMASKDMWEWISAKSIKSNA
jgi:hypothetical protein